ncbi:protein that induces appearance of [PIN+] prion when overproduced [Zygosaccharomyces mellis]|uniref:Protein that induces appearance of [PIN+] prion when overproduced n=1 Tax=Zygosaccharomyces mellis TaxID=42258 RepID=A0A4C2DYR5_9SACH|nr:protein that induces appearance of [PIN+] prion when overproduced [Zygosaccharomyces mellis]
MVFGHSRKEKSEGEYVEVLYEFKPQSKDDLHIKPGDKVEVLERLSPDWYKGKCNGKEGMFPSNYVKALGGEDAASRPAPPPPAEAQAQPQQEAAQPQEQTQQPQGQPMVVQQDQPKHRHHGLGKFGSKLGNAAIFGVGATLGNDLVDSIL